MHSIAYSLTFLYIPHPSARTHFSFHLPTMSHKREYYCCLLTLFMLATCFLPSLADTDAQVLINFKSFLSNADALNNWGNDSISLCSWTGLLCVNQTLHGLRLETMGLSGTINVDILLQLSTLRSFSVINNSFEGPMPAFKKLVGLRALFLSKNKFSGEIPDDAFEGLRRLKRVFLAENGFTGHIPTSLAQLPRLLDVDLHGNSFGGNIPEFQQRDFRVFDLSNNHLEGPIPESLSNEDPGSFAGNQGLCGKPLSLPCSSSSSPPRTLPHQENGHKKHRALIIIIIFVVVVVVILASILAFVFIRYRRRQAARPVQVENAQSRSQNTNNGAVSSEAKSIDVAVAVASEPKKSQDGDLSFVKNERAAFDLQDLLRASAEVLGSGSFGSTYKAKVLNGPVVVVKRFKHMNSVGKKEFFEHTRRLGRLTHPNLLPLVAFYFGKEEKLLVHDFVENGSLASHLHGRGGGCELNWPTRLKIIKGVAGGLAHLYREFPDEKVPHGHLKSSNVVLDSSFEPRLTEYGIVAVMEKRHAQQFMAAFKSPEVSSEKEGPSEKSDVWCLGILILELLTGKFPANYLRHGKGASEELAAWVDSIVREGWSGEVLDRSISGSRDGEGEMLKLLRIGMGCCEWGLKNRWDWREAVAKIEELKERDDGDQTMSRDHDLSL